MTRVARVWSPWREISRIEREMSDIFGLPHLAAFQASERWPINVFQNQNSAAITAVLPGLNTDELDVTVTGDMLTLKGTHANHAIAEGATCQRCERSLEPVERTIALPFEVDPESAEAVYENGVLTVRVSRPVHQQPKKIHLKPGQSESAHHRAQSETGENSPHSTPSGQA